MTPADGEYVREILRLENVLKVELQHPYQLAGTLAQETAEQGGSMNVPVVTSGLAEIEERAAEWILRMDRGEDCADQREQSWSSVFVIWSFPLVCGSDSSTTA